VFVSTATGEAALRIIVGEGQVPRAHLGTNLANLCLWNAKSPTGEVANSKGSSLRPLQPHMITRTGPDRAGQPPRRRSRGALYPSMGSEYGDDHGRVTVETIANILVDPRLHSRSQGPMYGVVGRWVVQHSEADQTSSEVPENHTGSSSVSYRAQTGGVHKARRLKKVAVDLGRVRLNP
jgi:hypothetical protein